MALNIFLLEDNRIELQQFQVLINSLAHSLTKQVQLHCFSTCQALLQQLPTPDDADVFILDLEIDGQMQAGLQLSQQIRQHDSLATIIFLTTHDEFLYTSYKYRVNALDFIDKKQGLIKHDLEADLKTVISRQQRSNTPKISLKDNTGVFQIAVDKIAYFETDHVKTRHSFLVTTDNQRREVNASLNQLTDQLSQYYFFRVHRAYLANVTNIRQYLIKEQRIQFNGTITCPVSRLKRKDLLAMLSKYNTASQIRWSKNRN